MAHITLKAEIHLIACTLVAIYSLSMLSLGPGKESSHVSNTPSETAINSTSNENEAVTPLNEIDPGSDDALDELKEHAEALLDE